MAKTNAMPVVLPKMETRDKIYLHLFKSDEEAKNFLAPHELEIKRRWIAIYSKWLDDPFLPVSDMVKFIESGGEGAFSKMDRSTAYRDVEIVQSMLGNMKNATKSWVRHLVYESSMQALGWAVDDKDAKAVAAIADKLIKAFNLDKEDVDPMDWEKMVPPNFEPTDDITVLGVDPIENIESRRKALRKMFGIGEAKVIDAEVIEE